MKQDGIRFKDFSTMYLNKKPHVFNLVIKILLGEDPYCTQD